jgi:hypothetical protein
MANKDSKAVSIDDLAAGIPHQEYCRIAEGRYQLLIQYTRIPASREERKKMLGILYSDGDTVKLRGRSVDDPAVGDNEMQRACVNVRNDAYHALKKYTSLEKNIKVLAAADDATLLSWRNMYESHQELCSDEDEQPPVSDRDVTLISHELKRRGISVGEDAQHRICG